MLDKNTILRCNQTLETYLKVSVGDSVYNLVKYDKTQLTDTTILRYLRMGGCILKKWSNKCNDKIGNDKIQKFIKSSKGSKPTPYCNPSTAPPIGDSF